MPILTPIHVIRVVRSHWQAGFVLAFLALATAGPALAAPAPPDSMRRASTPQFDVYATSEKEIMAATQELRRAASQFNRYVGDRPPRIAVVVFDSAERMKGYDFASLREHGLAPLAWIAPPPGAGLAAGEGGAHAAVGASAAKRAKISGASAAAVSEFPTSLGHAAGHLFFSVWVRAKLAGADVTGRAAARAEALRSVVLTLPLPTAEPQHALSDQFPDWYEEAIATLCESPPVQARRIDAMRGQLDRRVPLAELFDMSRPHGPGTVARADLFDDESLALARYIAEIEGDRFFGNIASGFVTGKSVGETLTNAAQLMSKPEALEKSWVEWMAPPR